MSDYQKYDIASDDNVEFKEHYEAIYQTTSENIKLKDNKPDYYKLGVKRECNEIKHPINLGFVGYRGPACDSKIIDGPKEQKNKDYCDVTPWFCNKNY